MNTLQIYVHINQVKIPPDFDPKLPVFFPPTRLEANQSRKKRQTDRRQSGSLLLSKTSIVEHTIRIPLGVENRIRACKDINVELSNSTKTVLLNKTFRQPAILGLHVLHSMRIKGISHCNANTLSPIFNGSLAIGLTCKTHIEAPWFLTLLMLWYITPQQMNLERLSLLNLLSSSSITLKVINAPCNAQTSMDILCVAK